MRERGLLCRDADVAHHREVEAAREGRTVHGRDQRQREVETRAVVAIARRPQPFADLGLVHALELTEVEAGTEHVACTRDDDGLDLLVAASSSSASEISSRSAMDSALRFSGRFNVSVTTPSSTGLFSSSGSMGL